MNDDRALLLGFVGVLLAVAVLLAGIVWVMNELSFPGQKAQIDQLRYDVEYVRDPNSEDVIGQVTQWNQTIRSYQAYNDIPIAGLFVPDGWDEISLIELPGVRP